MQLFSEEKLDTKTGLHMSEERSFTWFWWLVFFTLYEDSRKKQLNTGFWALVQLEKFSSDQDALSIQRQEAEITTEIASSKKKDNTLYNLITLNMLCLLLE